MAKDQIRQGIFESMGNLLKKLLSRSSPEDLTNELQELIDEGEAKGLISEEESDMVMSVLDLKDTRAYSIMVPRIQVIAANVNTSLAEILDLINTHGFTRIPIYQGSLDEIIGILHAKDLLKLWGKDLQDKLAKELLRPPFFAPHNIRIMDLLKELRQNKMHMAVLTDEYGGTVGIVTIEDILEEIVGEIQDEYDKEEQLIIEHSDGSFLVDGRTDAEEFAEKIGISLPEGDFESMAGFLINLYGKIPKQGEVIFYEGYEFIIEKADMRKIYKILVRKTNNIKDETQS